jgi:hypothetical protein
MRLLKLDPRPPSYDSVVEASLDDEAAQVVDATIEMAEWSPLRPARPASMPQLAFVDGALSAARPLAQSASPVGATSVP